MSYPLPIDELDRLQDLATYRILDTPSEPFFDRITSLAGHLCDMPMAIISFVDGNRVWFKSGFGTSAKEIPRDASYCTHTILRSGVLMVEDALESQRLSKRAKDRGIPGLRSYAGAPLLSSNKHALGSLCVIDYAPRLLSRTQSMQLEMLALQVVNQLELRKAMQTLKQQSTILEKTQSVAHIGGWEVDLKTNSVNWTDETYRIHGVTRQTHSPTISSGIEWYAPSSRPIIRGAFDALMKRGTSYDLELQIVPKGGGVRWIRTTAQRDRTEPGEERIYGTFQDISERRELETEVLNVTNRELVLIGTNLHEGLKQELSAMNFLLHDMAAQVLGRSPEAQRHIDSLSRSIRDAIDTCNSLTHGSFPMARERGGLFLSLRALGARHARVYDVEVQVRCKGQDWSFDSFLAEHIYRIVQEAMASAVKHAYARKIVVSMTVGKSQTTLSITDDGLGDVGAAYLEGTSLQIIRHRARVMGASLTIGSTKRGGTQICCRLAPADAN